MTAIGYERRIGERRRIPPIDAFWSDEALAPAGTEPVACRLVDVSVTGAAVHLPIATPLRLGSSVALGYAGGITMVRVCRAELSPVVNEIRVGVEYVSLHPLLEREVHRILSLGRPAEETWLHHSR